MFNKTVALVIAVFLPNLHIALCDDTVRSGPRSIQIARMADRPGPVALGFVGTAGKAKELPDGTPFVVEVGIHAEENVPDIFPSAATDGYACSFAKLELGNVVRILDGVYRITHTAPLTLDRVAEKEWPATMKVNAITYVLSMGDGGGLYGHQIFVSNRSHTLESGKTQVAVTVSGETNPAYKPQMVEEGGVFVVRGRTHRVRSVVLPDPKQKIVGYVEIDQVPIAVEEGK